MCRAAAGAGCEASEGDGGDGGFRRMCRPAGHWGGADIQPLPAAAGHSPCGNASHRRAIAAGIHQSSCRCHSSHGEMRLLF